MQKSSFIIAAAVILMTSCGVSPNQRESGIRETVLIENTKLSAATKEYGSLSVAYVNPTTRVIRIDGYNSGFERTVSMRVRKERFTGTGIIGRGVLGIYNPGDSRELPSGARRIVYEECEKHFSSVEEMERCLHSGSGVWDRTCSVDGLVLGIAVVENRNQINIQVWQLYVNGSKPDLSLRADLHRIGARLAVINQP